MQSPTAAPAPSSLYPQPGGEPQAPCPPYTEQDEKTHRLPFFTTTLPVTSLIPGQGAGGVLAGSCHPQSKCSSFKDRGSAQRSACKEGTEAPRRTWLGRVPGLGKATVGETCHRLSHNLERCSCQLKSSSLWLGRHSPRPSFSSIRWTQGSWFK